MPGVPIRAALLIAFIVRSWLHDRANRGGTHSVACVRIHGLRRSRPGVATCGYNLVVTSTGIRELKDNLSRYIRRVEAGERVAITAHGRVVAELVRRGSVTSSPVRWSPLCSSMTPTHCDRSGRADERSRRH